MLRSGFAAVWEFPVSAFSKHFPSSPHGILILKHHGTPTTNLSTTDPLGPLHSPSPQPDVSGDVAC